jgi:DNA-directed RNA polymerase II subunit RPB3
MEQHPGPVSTNKSTHRAKIEIVSATNMKLTAKITNTDLSVVTMLRRIIYSEVPTMAFDVISIDANTSNLSDEIVVSRLSLVPLSIVDPSILNCECKSGEVCENCNVTFYLNAMWQRNSRQKVRF